MDWFELGSCGTLIRECGGWSALDTGQNLAHVGKSNQQGRL